MALQMEKPCPNCSEDVFITLKNEAGYAKYWFDCPECGWESRTYRGPRRSESGIDDIGYDTHVERYREEAFEQAKDVEL